MAGIVSPLRFALKFHIMGKFILTKEFNGFPEGSEITVHDKHDKLMENYGNKADINDQPKNKAERVPKNKAEK